MKFGLFRPHIAMDVYVIICLEASAVIDIYNICFLAPLSLLLRPPL